MLRCMGSDVQKSVLPASDPSLGSYKFQRKLQLQLSVLKAEKWPAPRVQGMQVPGLLSCWPGAGFI